MTKMILPEGGLPPLSWRDDGLLPAIAWDGVNVRMLGSVSPESLQITIDEGQLCFYSRSRKKLWRKGETSGNVLGVQEIRADCEGNSLLFKVQPNGPTCHTQTETCFDGQDKIIAWRQTERPERAGITSVNTLLRDLVSAAERIVVPPLSQDSEGNISTFEAAADYEIPKAVWQQDYLVSDGKSFQVARGNDIPRLVANDLADIGPVTTEQRIESGSETVQNIRISDTEVCRLVLLTREEDALQLQENVLWTPRSGRRDSLEVVTGFPRYLASLAVAGDMPLRPSDFAPLGKVEAMLRMQNSSGEYRYNLAADRWVTGSTAARLGLAKIMDLATIYPEVVIRRQDADAYQSAA